MAPANPSHRRTHNLLLISKLLSQRDHASPFTLVLDTLEQPAKPLLQEYVRRANFSRYFTIFLGFETVRQPAGVDAFVTCWNKTPSEISKVIASTLPKSASTQRVLILVDTLIPFAMLSAEPSGSPFNLTAYLSSLLLPPRSSPQLHLSLVAVYHTDVPLITRSQAYSPFALPLLTYLATTILTIHSLPVLIAEKAAGDRSLPTPVFGLSEEAEGVVVGLKPTARQIRPEDRGIVIEMEHRRKSGRGVHEWYFLPNSPKVQAQTPQSFHEFVILLDDHPFFKLKRDQTMSEQELAGMTFELGLTDRQRQEREGVVLPYFDAQKAGGGGYGPGEGGRILYDMGVEDDFDEEEDET